MNVNLIKRHIPLILLIGPFFVYLSTVCPTVYLGDSGELTAAAFSLGIPHPSGYPLYALIGKIFCLLPIGNIAFRMNLMSVFFSLVTIWIVYSIIFKITSSFISSIFGTLTLAFTPLFWGQTVSAEVYPLHCFFVALLIRLLIHWDEKRDLRGLAIFSFVAGLSFLNHLQTLMMAPSVLFLLIASDRKKVINLKTLSTISILFLFALTIYIYLPIRTHAGAAIHWGDPDTLQNFFNVVSGEHHRSDYIFNKSISAYAIRSKDALIMVLKQFGIISLFSVLGFIRLPILRWKIFYFGLIVFDFFYTVFLNTIFLEITLFNIPTLIVMAILAGYGISNLLERCKSIAKKGNTSLFQIIKIACCGVPVILLVSNYDISNQNRNYTAYEHATNIFRTISNNGTVFVAGDNILFPLTYTRIVSRMREDVSLYDRLNLFFRIPFMADNSDIADTLLDYRDISVRLEKNIIERNISHGVYFAVFNPYTLSAPDKYYLKNCGILTQVVPGQELIKNDDCTNIWNYYISMSLEEEFFRDFMTRELTAYFYLMKGMDLATRGAKNAGSKYLNMASQIGYNDEVICLSLAAFYIDRGFFKKAQDELEKCMRCSNNLHMVYNMWGAYYDRQGKYHEAVEFFKKAVSADPDNIIYYNNLGFALQETGKKRAAIEVFCKSLSINANQEKIKKIVNDHSLKSEPEKSPDAVFTK